MIGPVYKAQTSSDWFDQTKFNSIVVFSKKKKIVAYIFSTFVQF